MTLSATTPGLRAAARLLLLAAALATLLVVASPAAAARSCGRAVIDDWYEDGRVDGTYAFHCYDDAIESLPRDVRDYSNAKDEIQRALQARMRGESPPPARTDPSPVGSDDPDTPVSSEDGEDDGDDGGTSGTPGDDGGGGSEAAAPTDTESASSVPIPLLILAALALLLVAGGTAGYLLRRAQARRIPPAEA
jgi:hypothetical protein